MIESKELRIGNYVHEKHYGLRKVVKIDNRDGYDNLYRDAYGDASGGIIKPIPLTEEWLVKFGFVRTGYLTMELDDFSCYCEKDDGSDFINNFCLGDIELLDVTPKHVHQLQNLYHALTGEELEIKNK